MYELFSWLIQQLVLIIAIFLGLIIVSCINRHNVSSPIKVQSQIQPENKDDFVPRICKRIKYYFKNEFIQALFDNKNNLTAFATGIKSTGYHDIEMFVEKALNGSEVINEQHTLDDINKSINNPKMLEVFDQYLDNNKVFRVKRIFVLSLVPSYVKIGTDNYIRFYLRIYEKNLNK